MGKDIPKKSVIYMIYLDNAATTRVCPEAAEAALRCMTEGFGNPSSTHKPGRDARDALKAARGDIARAIGASPEELFFTAGGTEGDNWAIRSGAKLMRHRGRHIISSAVEHDAVRKSLDELEKEGFEITRLSPAPDGSVRTEDVLAALREDTILVSLMLVNNETGSVTDIAAIAKGLKASGSQALLHTDAVQAFLKVPFTAGSLGADMITLSGHKIHAPKGIGALYVRKALRLPPLLLGGGQEGGRRSGTENLPGICAFAAAVNAARQDTGAAERMKALRCRAVDGLRDAFPDLVLNGGGAPHILNAAFPGYRSEVLLNALDAKGVCVSMGSACKKGARSHVLEAMKLPQKVVAGSIRVSLCRFTTEEDIDGFVAAMAETLGALIRT